MRQRFIQSFSTSGDVQTAIDGGQLGKPYVAYLEDEERIDWNSKEATPPLSAQPLTFEIISADTITFIRNKTGTLSGDLYGPEVTIEYSLNDGPWIGILSTIEGTIIPVSNGDRIKFKGDNLSYTRGASAIFYTNTQLKVNGLYKMYGNIGSLVNSSDFINLGAFRERAFYQFFSNDTGLTEVSEIAFGNNIYVSNYWRMFCFQELFQGCRNLSFVKTTLHNFTSNPSQTREWLKDVSATGTFVKHPDATWSTGTSGIPANWTVEDADI